MLETRIRINDAQIRDTDDSDTDSFTQYSTSLSGRNRANSGTAKQLAKQHVLTEKLKKHLFKAVRENSPHVMDLLQAFITDDLDVVKFGVDFVHEHKSEERDMVLDKSFTAWEENFIHMCVYEGLQTVKESSLAAITQLASNATLPPVSRQTQQLLAQTLKGLVEEQIQHFVKETAWELFNALLEPNIERESALADKNKTTLVANWKGRRYTLCLADSDGYNRKKTKTIVMRPEVGISYQINISNRNAVLQEQSVSVDSYNGMLPFNLTDTNELVKTLLAAIKDEKNRLFLSQEILAYHLHYSRTAELQTGEAETSQLAARFTQENVWQHLYQAKMDNDRHIAALRKQKAAAQEKPRKSPHVSVFSAATSSLSEIPLAVFTSDTDELAGFLDDSDSSLLFREESHKTSDEEASIRHIKVKAIDKALYAAEAQADDIREKMQAHCSSHSICTQYVRQYANGTHARLGKWSASLYAKAKHIPLIIYDVPETDSAMTDGTGSDENLVEDKQCSTVSSQAVFTEKKIKHEKEQGSPPVFLAYRKNGLSFKPLLDISGVHEGTLSSSDTTSSESSFDSANKGKDENPNILKSYFADIQAEIYRTLTAQLLRSDYLANLADYSQHLEEQLEETDEQHKKAFYAKNEGVGTARTLNRELDTLSHVKAAKTKAMKQLSADTNTKTALCTALGIDEQPGSLEQVVYTVSLLPDAVRDDNGETLLHAAIKAENTKAVTFLVAKKADLFAQSTVWAGRYFYVVDALSKSKKGQGSKEGSFALSTHSSYKKYQGCYVFQREPAALFHIDHDRKAQKLNLNIKQFALYEKAAKGYQLRLRHAPPNEHELKQPGKLYLYFKPAAPSTPGQPSNEEASLECCGIAPNGKIKHISLEREKMGERVFQDITRELMRATQRGGALSKPTENYIFDLAKADLFYPETPLNDDIPLNAQVDKSLLKQFCTLVTDGNPEYVQTLFGMYEYYETPLLVAALKKDALTKESSLFFALLAYAQTALSEFSKRSELNLHPTLQAISSRATKLFTDAIKAYQMLQKSRLENSVDQFKQKVREFLGVDALAIRAWECALACGIVFKALKDQNFDGMAHTLNELFNYEHSPYKSGSALHQELKKAKMQTASLITRNRGCYDDAYMEFIAVPLNQKQEQLKSHVDSMNAQHEHERNVARQKIEALTATIEAQNTREKERDKVVLNLNTNSDVQKETIHGLTETVEGQGSMLLMLSEQMKVMAAEMKRMQEEQARSQESSQSQQTTFIMPGSAL